MVIYDPDHGRLTISLFTFPYCVVKNLKLFLPPIVMVIANRESQLIENVKNVFETV